MAEGVPQHIADLLSSSAYEHPVDDVIVVQTHISYVLLAGDFAYKIKKPLNLGFLDYTTLERRRLMCADEIRLNRRLCEGIYLGVVPIVKTTDGRHRLFGEGEAVEYAVQMRRVPAPHMMPSLLAAGGVDRTRLTTLASKVAAFHGRADTDERIAAYGRPSAVRANWDENFEQVRPHIGTTLDGVQFDAVRSYVERFLAIHSDLVDERADQGRVRDGHGDLRADSVVFAPEGSVCIMDCIEFNERLRCGDIASDVAFLAMDLEFRGHRREAEEFVSLYLEALGDDETLPAMLNFYRAYRAFIRGKVDSMLSEEAEVPSGERIEARLRARRYVELSASIASVQFPISIIVMVGLSGTGKSFVARALAARVGSVLLSTDAIRRSDTDRDSLGPRAYGEAGYTQERRAHVYESMFERAQEHLSLQRGVLLDATFLTSAQRDRARDLALSSNVPLLFVHTAAPEEAIRDRLAVRTIQASASDARWNTYLAQREAFETLNDVEPQQLVTLDSTRPLDELVDQTVSALSGTDERLS